METIRAVVRSLVFLVLLAGFLEMLLPLRETRKFLQVILGLFVLVAVLNPVVAFFRQAPVLNVGISEKQDAGTMQLDSILKQGKALQQTNLEEARTAYVKRLEEQVAVVARLVPGVQAAKARVTLAGTPLQQAEGTVDKIFVTVQPGQKNGDLSQIKPVENIGIIGSHLDGGPQQTQTTPPESGDLSARVHDTVVSLFGLRPEQVVVNMGSFR
ncbi:MAG TPA: stage III sporulation protein AF [Syntrophomonadaceae bacterium]|nr:stage III sporulation protein AF [Syntrophomonadaceae bacterium]